MTTNNYRKYASPYSSYLNQAPYLPSGRAVAPGIVGTRRIILSSGVQYNFETDPRLLARYNANSLNDISGNINVSMGPLVPTAGAVAVATGVDGNPCYQLRSASGGYFLTSAVPKYNTPCHVFVIAKAAAGSAAGQFWVSSQVGAGLQTVLSYSSAAALRIDGNANTTFACVPGNLNLLNYYGHALASRVSVNNGAYVTTPGVGANFGILNGLTLGALATGTNRANLDLYEIFVYQGQASPEFMAGLTAYVRRKYPSLALPVAPPAFSIAQTSLGGLFTAPFDFVLVGGQSNNSNFATSATTTAGANTFQLSNDNTISALQQLYDDSTNQLDTVSADALAGKAGGNGTALANAYVALSGRPLVLVPCALQGSSVNPQTGVSPTTWFPDAVRGQRLRDSLYGSMLARAKNMVSLGGTFRFLWWYQGENEAIAGGAALANFKKYTEYLFAQFFKDSGLPRKIVLQKIANTVSGASAPQIALIQADQASFATPGSCVVMPASSGPYEVDNVHLAAAACDAVGSAAGAAAFAAGF